VKPSLAAGWLADNIWARLEFKSLLLNKIFDFPLFLAKITALLQQL